MNGNLLRRLLTNPLIQLSSYLSYMEDMFDMTFDHFDVIDFEKDSKQEKAFKNTYRL